MRLAFILNWSRRFFHVMYAVSHCCNAIIYIYHNKEPLVLSLGNITVRRPAEQSHPPPAHHLFIHILFNTSLDDSLIRLYNPVTSQSMSPGWGEVPYWTLRVMS